jgi:hypothetical protein
MLPHYDQNWRACSMFSDHSLMPTTARDLLADQRGQKQLLPAASWLTPAKPFKRHLRATPDPKLK